MKSQENRRYPIGKFEHGKTYSLDETRRHIRTIAKLPKELKKALKKLKSSQLDLPYRRGGWTARQVVHHIVDSHLNAYIRMKLAVTEQAPIIKPYEENLWAETEDGKTAPVKISLRILAPLHKRWVMFLESLSEEDLERGYFHPSMKRLISLPEAIALYAWHGQHHMAHIRLVAEDKGHDKKAKISKPRVQKAKTIAAPSSVKAAAAAPKRKRRTSAEVAAEKAAKAAAPKLSRAEILAKARAARTANIAQKPAPKKAAAPAKRKRRTSAEVAAEKAAKAAAPKLSRAEILAKARAARTANIVKKAPAVKKAQPADGTKRKGMSAERMAEIRAMRGKKK